VDLRRLRYFVAVAEERHFGRAASRLRIAQPPLSRQIQELETELGFNLFVRSTRGVEITSAGKTLLIHAHKVFETVDHALQEARRAHRGETGRISVAYPSSLAYSGIIDILRTFRSKAPSVELVLRELAPQEQLAALREGSIDVGFLRGPFAEPMLVFEVIRREPLAIILPPEHALAKRKRLPLSALAQEPFVLFPRHRAPGFFDQLMNLFHEAGFVPKVVQEGNLLDITSLVAAGFGVSVLPSSLPKAHAQKLAVRAIVGEPQTELFVAWRKSADNPTVATFLDVVRKVGKCKAAMR
jgi:DNA-binding transcriptional LysR family regulator